MNVVEHEYNNFDVWVSGSVRSAVVSSTTTSEASLGFALKLVVARLHI